MGSFSCFGPLRQSRETAVPGVQFIPSSSILPYSMLSLPDPWTLDLKSLVCAVPVDCFENILTLFHL